MFEHPVILSPISAFIYHVISFVAGITVGIVATILAKIIKVSDPQDIPGVE